MYIETNFYAGDTIDSIEIPFDFSAIYETKVTNTTTRVGLWGGTVKIQEAEIDDVEEFDFELVGDTCESNKQSLSDWVNENYKLILFYLNHLTIEL